MVGKQGPSITSCSALFQDSGQPIQEFIPVLTCEEDRSSRYSSGDDMV